MEYFTQKGQEPYHLPFYDAKMDSSRKQNRYSHELPPATAEPANVNVNDGGSNSMRASFDSRDSLDIKHVMRAAFQKESSRLSVDGREIGSRGSPRFGGGEGSWYGKDGPRSSVDCVRGTQHLRASTDSPRLPLRFREGDRAGEGRVESGWSSFDSRESLRYTPSVNSSISRPPEVPTPRSSSSDSRLLVELRESPRLSRDAPRYSCDGRDVLRSSATLDNVSAVLAREELAKVNASNIKDSSRILADGRAVPSNIALRPSTDNRDGPYIPREMLMAGRAELSYRSNRGAQPDVDGDHPQLQRPHKDERKRAPSLVARLMGLEDMPDSAKQHGFLQPPQSGTPSFGSQHIPDRLGSQYTSVAPVKQPSKESKLLKGLLLYNPPVDDTSSQCDSRAGDTQDLEQLKYMFGSRRKQQQQVDSLPTITPQAAYHDQHPHVWNDGLEAPPRPIRLPSKHLRLESMPSAFKQQEAKEMGILRQRVVHGMPKQLTEAVLTALKISDDNQKLPLSYADMENRLRHLKLRSSLQEHKTLRQVLEAMQVKGLLSGASRTKESHMDGSGRHHQAEVKQPQVTTLPNSPKKIILPKPQEYNPDACRVRNFEDLKRVGTGLRERASESIPEETVAKASRPHSQSMSSKMARELDEQEQSTSGVSIVVMKPVVNLARKSNRAQNPALVIESMPGARSANRGKDSSGRTSTGGSPANRPKQQPGFGFGRGPTGRINSEGATQRPRREKMMSKVGQNNTQAEVNISKESTLIALPQSTAKVPSPASREDAEISRSVKVDSTVESTRMGEKGKRVPRPTSSKEELPVKGAPKVISARLQPSRSSSGNKAPDASADTEKSRKSNYDGKMPYERTRTKNSGPAEVIILRNRSSTGKRVSMAESDSRSRAGKGSVSNSVLRSGIEETTNSRSSPSFAPSTPRNLAKINATERTKRKDEQQGGEIADRVRETGGAQDLINVRTPLIGLTNRLQSTEVGLSEPDKEVIGVKTPRTGVLTKKMSLNRDEETLTGSIDEDSEQPQPSPVSVLDPGSFQEDDVSPYVLNKASDVIRDHCDIGDRNAGVSSVKDIITPLAEAQSGKSHSSVDDGSSQQLIFLRECAKILPPQGDAKPLILQNQAEKVYVRDILVVSGVTMDTKTARANDGRLIDSTVFYYLEDKQAATDYALEQRAADDLQDAEKGKVEKERQVLERRMLFDCVNDSLATILDPYLHCEPWREGLSTVQPLRRRPTGQALVQQLWDELSSLPPQKPCDDVCVSLYSVLQRDLLQPRNSWTEFANELEGVGLEIERMILKDLIEETLIDMSQGALLTT